MTMADTVMTVRLVVKEVAARHGIAATFMPKPLTGVQGSGMHTHMSLFAGGVNAFYDESDEYHLSRTARQFIAGLLAHARELTAVTNQWVNSYKRLIVGYEAPVYISWARNNRSALVRVPPTKVGKAESTRIEYRAPDPATNPYLAFAALLAAGLAGIQGDYKLPEEAASNLYELSANQRGALGIQSLPGSLSEALDAMEGSDLMARLLGEHVFEWFVRNKRSEWADYKAEVSEFEWRRYLTAL
jgi:glutamine synthetase